MIVYRIAKTIYVRDLSGIGTRLYGSRWSPPGIPVVHTSESRALAALEYYVHTAGHRMPPGISIASIEIPDSAPIKNIDVKALPPDWKSYPAPLILQDVGMKWVKSGDSLLLKVPSVQTPPECNVLINPAHPEMITVRIIKVEDFYYDQRLIKK